MISSQKLRPLDHEAGLVLCILSRVFEQLVDRMLLATFNIFYDVQHLATVLISVFRLCYGPGLLFRGPLCIIWL